MVSINNWSSTDMFFGVMLTDIQMELILQPVLLLLPLH